MRLTTRSRIRRHAPTTHPPVLDLTTKPYLNAREAANLLALSVWTIRHAARIGTLTCIRVGSRMLFDRADLIRFMERQKHRSHNSATRGRQPRPS